MKIFNLFLFIFLIGNAIAQDQLFKKDNSKFDVKIIEINPDEIKYKLFNYPDGPLITVSKSEVALIIYSNGIHEVINYESQKPLIIINRKDEEIDGKIKQRENTALYKTQLYDSLTKFKHILSFNTIEPINGSLSLNYIYELPNYFLNLYIPISVGFIEPVFNQLFDGSYYTDYYNQNYYVSNYKLKRKAFESGIGIHFHTSGKRAVSHYIGPYFGFMQFNGNYTENYRIWDSSGYYAEVSSIERGFVLNRYQFMVNNGFLFRINKHLNMNLLAGIGFGRDEYISGLSFVNRNYLTNNPIAFKLNLSIGYRF
jgi:hypothetical protein